MRTTKIRRAGRITQPYLQSAAKTPSPSAKARRLPLPIRNLLLTHSLQNIPWAQKMSPDTKKPVVTHWLFLSSHPLISSCP